MSFIQVDYELCDDGQVAILQIGGSFEMSRTEIEDAIQNITARRYAYATEVAYNKHLAVYTGALAFLDEQRVVTQPVNAEV
jgi:hypothetical protein